MQRRLSPFVLASLVCLSMAVGSASTGCDDGTGATGGTGGAGATGGTGGTGATGGTAGTGGTGGAGATGGTASTGGSGGAGGAPDTACFDYSGFDGMMPVVSFKSDVLPIFQQSCGVSASCHGDPSVPNENRPYLGPNAATRSPSSTTCSSGARRTRRSSRHMRQAPRDCVRRQAGG